MNTELCHYGVKGMKWGHRKNKSSVSQRISERRATYGRGKNIYKNLTDNGKHGRDSDYYRNRYKQLSKKQVKDVESYRHDYNTQQAVSSAMMVIGAMGMGYLYVYKPYKEKQVAQALHDMWY